MNSYSNIDCGDRSAVNRSFNNISRNSTLNAEHYNSMDLCSQAQMSEGTDNILSRMDSLRAFAREQQAKRVEAQRLQTSFCF